MFSLAQAGTLRPRPGSEIQSALIRTDVSCEWSDSGHVFTLTAEGNTVGDSRGQ